MVAFSNSHGGKLLYAGAGSGVRRALEYNLDVIFSNGVGQREITNSYNEFVITIPHNSEQVTNQPENNSNQPQDKSSQINDKSNQVKDNLVTRKLTKKEQDIRNFCSVPRTAQEIMDRLGITNQSKNRKNI